MITVSDTTVLRVTRMVERGVDPLGIGLGEDHRLARTRATLERAIAGIDGTVADRVAEAIVGILSGRRTIGNPRGVMPMDPLAAACLAQLGIDPLVATLVALDVGMVAYDDTVTGYQAASVDGTSPANEASTEIMLGVASWTQRSTWETVRLLVSSDALPTTLMPLAAGRPLRDILSHPVLDAWPLTIVEVDEREVVTHLHTDHRPRPATMDQLLAASRSMRG